MGCPAAQALEWNSSYGIWHQLLMKSKHSHLNPWLRRDSEGWHLCGHFTCRKDTFFVAMPSGLLLHKLQNLTCGLPVADWVEGMSLWGQW